MEKIKEIESKYVHKFSTYAKKIVEISRKDEMKILPGNIAFFLILSIIPIITLVGLAGANFSYSMSQIIEFVTKTFPKDVVNLLLPFIKTAQQSRDNMPIYLLLGFIMASNGAHSIIIASNALYDVEDKNYLFRRIKALFLTIILVILFVFVLIVLAFGNKIYNVLTTYKILTYSDTIVTIYNSLKWPISFFVIFFAIKLLYTMAVDIKVKSKYITQGALFTTIGWIILTALYSVYANSYAHYDVFYGSLSNFIILMIWIYLLSYVLVIGIAINASIYQNLVKIGIIKQEK